MTLLAGSRDSSSRRSGVISVLDVGSSKVCCVIGRLKPCEESQHLRGRTHKVEVIGIGHQRAVGIKSGVIIDLDRAEQAIRLAVDAAERMAGLTIDSLIVNLSAGRLSSEVFSANIDLGGHAATSADVKRVLAAGAKLAFDDERRVVHSLPTGFSLDGERGIQNPRGMIGDALGVDMHVLTADIAPQRNLELCINRSHLSVDKMVATPYASGLAALVDDEAELGSACIDLGGGTTTISIFANGKFVHSDAIAVGGHHVTMDLARGLSTRLEDAERLKVMHGSALPSGADDRELISVPAIGDDDGNGAVQLSRSIVTRIIRARIEETLELIRDRLNRSGYGNVIGKRVILTGGASQLTGLVEAARRVLGRTVRIGRPMGIAGLPEAAKGPAFSTAVGLMIYPQVAGFENHQERRNQSALMSGTGGRIARVGQWFRDSF